MKAWAKWLVAAVVVVVFVTAAGFVVLQVPEMLLLRSLVLNLVTMRVVSLFTFSIGYKKIHEKHIRLGSTRAPWWVAYVVAGLGFWLAAYLSTLLEYMSLIGPMVAYIEWLGGSLEQLKWFY